MLPPASRLRTRSDFTDVVRRGRRAGRPTLTVHLAGPVDAVETGAVPPARAGLVVSKVVGGSVVRTRVSRRLRHLLRDRLATLEPGTRVVVRAAPAAASSSSRELGLDLDAAFARLSRPTGPRSTTRRPPPAASGASA